MRLRDIRIPKEAIRKTSKGIKTASRKIANIEPPQSITWFYTFGFKVGVFLLLKSFLILKHQAFNLEPSGLIMVLGQFAQGVILTVHGMLLQDRRIFESPDKLAHAIRPFGWMFCGNVVIFILRETMNWSFFKAPTSVNWFADFFAKIGNGLSEFSLSVLFWDFDLWGVYCGLAYFMTLKYVQYVYNIQSNISVYFKMLSPLQGTPLITGDYMSPECSNDSIEDINPPEH